MDLLKNLNNMITAEEFYEENATGFLDINDCQKLMIEFAKLHVEAALKAASKQVIVNNYIGEGGIKVSKNSILNAYSLDNIK